MTIKKMRKRLRNRLPRALEGRIFLFLNLYLFSEKLENLIRNHRHKYQKTNPAPLTQLTVRSAIVVEDCFDSQQNPSAIERGEWHQIQERQIDESLR